MKYFLPISVVVLLLVFCNASAQALQPRKNFTFDIDKTKKIDFYPNPSRGSFKIDIFDKDIKEIKLTIYNLNGLVVFEKVLSGLFPGISLDMKLKKPGLYLVKINTGKENIIEKLLVKP